MAKKHSENPEQKKRLVQVYRRALAQGEPLEKIEALVNKYAARARVADKGDGADEVAYERRLYAELPIYARFIVRALPFSFLLFGGFLLSSAIFPILSYHVRASVGQLQELDSPIPKTEILQERVELAALPDTAANEPEPTVAPLLFNSSADYTNLENWFPADSNIHFSAPTSSQDYRLDIPSLKLENATVKIGGSNLSESLIQYPGTADPGELGAPVIFGHSVLRQFYNPKESNPRRYNSIFSTIMTLNAGDKIYLTRDGKRYTYEVIRKTDVKPDDTYILLQKYDSRLLKLVTCVPEGTFERRGVVTAQLIE